MLKLVLLALLVLLVVAAVKASRNRGPGSPAARRAKAATDQAVISRQGHNAGWQGGGHGS